ncbi:MAG: hypothetical protein P0121_08270 [Nitrospira sp.]|nr:hypothetical protein [Nitrospira sp.]
MTNEAVNKPDSISHKPYSMRQTEAAQRQTEQNYEESLARYNVFSACMIGRGYRVG